MKNQFPNIPAILPQRSDLSTTGTSRMIPKWSYEEGRIGETVMVRGEKVKKLLTLDLNMPSASFAEKVNSAPEELRDHIFREYYECIHGCGNCFNNAKVRNPLLTLPEMWNVVDQTRELGSESVKFLGPGELTINPDLFEILDGFLKRNMVLGLFTKGAVLGNDDLAIHFHNMNSEELVKRLVSYPNVTFLVGGRSFDPVLENGFIPPNRKKCQIVFDYHTARNLALERLAIAGMNKDIRKPRLAIIAGPVTWQSIAGVGEIYRWGAERQIPVYMAPTMVSGKGHCGEKQARDPKFEKDYEDLAVDTYIWAIERGVMSFSQFLDEGPTPYIGVAPCNQLTHGLYVHYDGEVWRCPGNDTQDFVVSANIRNMPLIEIWKGSKNYRINQFNNGCVKDGFSLAKSFYSNVKRRVIEKVG